MLKTNPWKPPRRSAKAVKAIKRTFNVKNNPTNNNYKRWGPKFVIIENNKQDGGQFLRPELDKNTKIIQYNTGPEDRVPDFSYSYKNYEHSSVSTPKSIYNPSISTNNLRDKTQNNVDQARYPPTLVNHAKTTTQEKYKISSDSALLPTLSKPNTNVVMFRGQPIPPQKLIKEKQINTDGKRILNLPDEEMQRLATNYLSPLSYKRYNAPQFLKTKSAVYTKLDPNKAADLYKAVLAEKEKLDTHGVTSGDNKKYNELDAHAVMPGDHKKYNDESKQFNPTLRQTQEVVNTLLTHTTNNKIGYQTKLNQKIKALNDEMISRYYSKHPEMKPGATMPSAIRTGIRDRMDEPQYGTYQGPSISKFTKRHKENLMERESKDEDNYGLENRQKEEYTHIKGDAYEGNNSSYSHEKKLKENKELESKPLKSKEKMQSGNDKSGNQLICLFVCFLSVG